MMCGCRSELHWNHVRRDNAYPERKISPSRTTRLPSPSTGNPPTSRQFPTFSGDAAILGPSMTLSRGGGVSGESLVRSPARREGRRVRDECRAVDHAVSVNKSNDHSIRKQATWKNHAAFGGCACMRVCEHRLRQCTGGAGWRVQAEQLGAWGTKRKSNQAVSSIQTQRYWRSTKGSENKVWLSRYAADHRAGAYMRWPHSHRDRE
jgi:hypothetical protein